MADFKKSVGTDKGTYDFSFTRIWTPKIPKYFVTVEVDGITHSFDIVRMGDIWKIVPPVAVWIEEIEWKLSLAIEAHHVD